MMIARQIEFDMKKTIMIVSLVFSLVLYLAFELTGNETVLAPLLSGLVISFTCAMLLLTEK